MHEPMTLLAYVAAVTEHIELVPSVIVLPSRQTALFAKQAAELDVLCGGRLRLGIGVGNNKAEYLSMGQDFNTRGKRCDEQLKLLKLLWTEENVNFDGRWDKVTDAGLNPLPIQRPIPIWIGARSIPGESVIKRIASQADGWFVLCTPEEFPDISARIQRQAQAINKNPADICTEAGVAVVGPRQTEWRDRISGWRALGLTHLCLRTLGGGLEPQQHMDKLGEIMEQIPQQ